MVLLALSLHGYTGVMLQVLGPSHIHAGAIDAGIDGRGAGAAHGSIVSGLLAVKVWIQAQRPHTAIALMQERSRSHSNAHSHGLFERHHHDGNDPTVVAVDAAEADATSGSGTNAGSATMPLALATALSLPAAPEPVRAWLASACGLLLEPDPLLPFRPPRA